MTPEDFLDFLAVSSSGWSISKIEVDNWYLDDLSAKQGRILLEEAYKALGSTTLGVTEYYGQEVGVYAGCMYQEYSEILAQGGGKLNAASATGNSLAFLVGR